VGALTLELCTVVCGDRVENDNPDVVAREEDWDLKLQDVILSFQVWGDGAVDSIK
jgi:hypothetical protein